MTNNENKTASVLQVRYCHLRTWTRRKLQKEAIYLYKVNSSKEIINLERKHTTDPATIFNYRSQVKAKDNRVLSIKISIH
jgi:hypothetical protein